MLSYPNRPVLVALIASKLLVKPRVRVSTEPQATLRFPLFYGTNETLNAILTRIRKVFLVLDDLADFADESVVMADHSIKAIIFLDAVRPTVVEQNHFIVR